MNTEEPEIDQSKLLQEEDPMPIGKHRGKPMKDVPNAYLGKLWVFSNFHTFKVRRGVAGYIAEYIERRFEKRRSEIPKEKWPQYLRVGLPEFADLKVGYYHFN